MKSKYIKSPINYIGNKYKLIEQIVRIFPSKINFFADIFGGSGTVLINTNAQYYLYNDINPYVSSIFDGMINTNYENIINAIDNIIHEYALSKTNKEGFEQLREDYNNGKNDWLTLYTLMCYSFNYQFRFNNNHKYNSSFGKNRSCFSSNQRKSILVMQQKIGQKKSEIVIYSKNFMGIDYSDFNGDDLLYFDPPYYNSIGNYNDGKRGFEGWSVEHEKALLSLLDKLNNQGTRFALSNNLKYDNPLLDKWKNKYHVHYISSNYENCNYHKLDKSRDYEVLITNY